jgi:hypothetical protein
VIGEKIPSIPPPHFSCRILQPVKGSPWRLHQLAGHPADIWGVVEGELVGAFRFVTAEVKLWNQIFDLELPEVVNCYQGRLDFGDSVRKELAKFAVAVVREYEPQKLLADGKLHNTSNCDVHKSES